MICERCGTVFCWDDADLVFVGATPRRFCSEKCKKKASSGRRYRKELAAAYELAAPRLAAEAEARRMREEARPACPTPAKLAFPEAGDALDKALRVAQRFDRPCRAYECVCGNWHLTAKWVKVPAPPGTVKFMEPKQPAR